MSANGSFSSIPTPPDYSENGRTYHGFRRGIYMFPCDEIERERMDIYHKLFMIARSNGLHRCRLSTTDEVRIMDIGCGTGIWAIDMADKYPNAEVMGLDLTNMQPERIPPNLRFRVPRDFEAPNWALGEDSWDLIHIQQACGSVQSWPELYQNVFAHLKPGPGCLEQVEIDLQPRCDDGTLQGPILEWYEYLVDATRRAARPIEYQHNTRQMLEAAGFTDIQEQIIRAPFSPWPKDAQLKELGRWYCIGLSAGLEGLSLAPLMRVYGWPAANVRRLVKDVKACVTSKKFHGYNNIHIWTARRPQQ